MYHYIFLVSFLTGKDRVNVTCSNQTFILGVLKTRVILI